jgi:hypothetical protein
MEKKNNMEKKNIENKSNTLFFYTRDKKAA